MLSRGSEMVVVDGTLDRHPGKLSHFGFDLESGAMKLSINTGADLRFNGAFTGIKSDGDRALTSTTLFGLVRFDVDRMAPTASPDYGDYRCTPSG